MLTLVDQEKSKYDRMWDYPGYKVWGGDRPKIIGNGEFWAGYLVPVYYNRSKLNNFRRI